jgi:hypothetical protein
MGFRAVRWLDLDHVLLAFNVDPVCPAHADKAPYPLPSTLRLVTLDLAGNVLRSRDLPYQAPLDDYRDAKRNGGIWLGPQDSILVHLQGLPTGRLLVLSRNLELIQEIKTDAYQGSDFEGTLDDRNAVFFSRGKEAVNRECVKYEGIPLTEAGPCSVADLERVRSQFEPTDAYRTTRGHYAVRLGSSDDEKRWIVFVGKEPGNFCSLTGQFCSSHGTLLVHDQPSGRTLFRIRHFREDGRAAISGDGKRLATFVGNRLEILRVE